MEGDINEPNVKISFGIIVLNGEPFTKYCLRQLYPHAHEIIVVEGGSEKAKHICPGGTSNDGTLESLYDFKENEDPDNKLIIITTEGFWRDKDEQSQAYAKKATGNFLWQVDIDEFYRDEDIEKIRSYLEANPGIDTVSFRQITFWGDIKYWCNSIYLTAVNASEYHRLFKWHDGYQYVAHRPPTVVDSEGVDLRDKRWVKALESKKIGVNLYHYSLLFPKQVKEKCKYYSTPGESYKTDMDLWAENCYFRLTNPFKLHNVEQYPSWIMEYVGTHPREILRLMNDIKDQVIEVELRDNEDIRKLLEKKSYLLNRAILIGADKVGVFKMLLAIRGIFKKVVG